MPWALKSAKENWKLAITALHWNRASQKNSAMLYPSSLLVMFTCFCQIGLLVCLKVYDSRYLESQKGIHWFSIFWRVFTQVLPQWGIFCSWEILGVWSRNERKWRSENRKAGVLYLAERGKIINTFIQVVTCPSFSIAIVNNNNNDNKN